MAKNLDGIQCGTQVRKGACAAILAAQVVIILTTRAVKLHIIPSIKSTCTTSVATSVIEVA